MAQSAFTGPVVSLGSFAGGSGVQPLEYSSEIGPSIFWQGAGLLGVGARGSKDQKGAGAIPALFLSTTVLVLNQVLAVGGVTFATGQATAGAPLPNIATGTASIGVGSDGGTAVALDPGFAAVTSTASSGVYTIAAADAWRFQPGQFISVAGAGPAGRMIFGKVLSLSGTTLTTTAIATTAGACSIGAVAGDPASYGWTPSRYSHFMLGGSGKFILPDAAAARGVGITGVAGGTGGPVLIAGFDIWGRPTSETITAAAGAGTTYGKKTYKVVASVTPQFTDAHAYSAVTSDLIGFPICVLQNEPAATIAVAGAAYTTGVWQYADITNPATLTTGDPRGGYQMSTKGPGSGATGGGPDGSSRIVIAQTLNPAQVLSAGAINPTTLFGVAPI